MFAEEDHDEMNVDVEPADACYEEARQTGLVAKKRTNPNFRVDLCLVGGDAWHTNNARHRVCV